MFNVFSQLVVLIIYLKRSKWPTSLPIIFDTCEARDTMAVKVLRVLATNQVATFYVGEIQE